MKSWWLLLMTLSSRDSATTRLGKQRVPVNRDWHMLIFARLPCCLRRCGFGVSCWDSRGETGLLGVTWVWLVRGRCAGGWVAVASDRGPPGGGRGGGAGPVAVPVRLRGGVSGVVGGTRVQPGDDRE